MKTAMVALLVAMSATFSYSIVGEDAALAQQCAAMWGCATHDCQGYPISTKLVYRGWGSKEWCSTFFSLTASQCLDLYSGIDCSTGPIPWGSQIPSGTYCMM